MRISVVIPTLRRPEILRETLRSLALCSPAPSEVIVVDGDEGRSAKDVVEALQGDGTPLRYVPSSPGLTHQRNVGVEHAAGDVILFADDDVTFGRDVFAVLDRAYDDQGVVGATGRVIEQAGEQRIGKESRLRRLLPGGGREGTFTRFGYPRRILEVDEPRDVEFMQGCFMSARKEAVASVGFDERLAGYALAEDEDFSCRLSRVGRIRYLPEAVVHHRNTGFSTRDPRVFGRQVVVNRAYLFRKNFPRSPLASLQFAMLVAMLLVHRLVNAEWRGAAGILEGAWAAWRRRE